MNKIYWDRDKISIITDQIESVQHKHCTMQLFLSVEQELKIRVGEQQIPCKCIVINRNIPHSFSTGNSIHFSMIIEPTASIAEQLDEIMCGKEYHAFDNQNIVQLQFREQVGILLKSYIQFHQMQKAFLTLLNGKNITEAAMLAGFDTPSHFAAVTKRMMGMPASISLEDSVF